MNTRSTVWKYSAIVGSCCLMAGFAAMTHADSMNEVSAPPGGAPVAAAPVLQVAPAGKPASNTVNKTEAPSTISLSSPINILNSGVVKGTHSNVRARPSLTGEPIVQLNKGDAVAVIECKIGTEGEKPMDWLHIQLPKQAKCYVSASLVSKGIVKSDELIVRCGPSTNHREIGKLSKGDHVEVVKTEGAWLQIKPTQKCTGWIAAELVELTSTPVPPAPVVSPVETVPSAPPITMPLTLPTPVAPVAAKEAPSKPVVTILDTDPDVIVQYIVKDGYLQSATETNPLAKYELMTPEQNRLQERMCYVESDRLSLKRFEGKHVRIAGNEQWKKGDRYPVLIVDRIDIVW